MAEPIPMVLHCPSCSMQHIDAPDEDAGAYPDGRETKWNNPPHRSHLCHGCGTIWRPADVPTVGVADTQTHGKADAIKPPAQAAQVVPEWLIKGLRLIAGTDGAEVGSPRGKAAELLARLSATAEPVAQGEVVACRYRFGDGNGGWLGWIYSGRPTIKTLPADTVQVDPLYTHPAAPMGVPDERKLVGYVWPNEADYDHIHRCLGVDGDPEIRRIPAGAVGVYAMLAAAPSPGEPA